MRYDWEIAKSCDPREKWNKFHLEKDEFTEKEDSGSRLTGSSRLHVLAISEGMQE